MSLKLENNYVLDKEIEITIDNISLNCIIEELPKINRYKNLEEIFYSAAQHAYEIAEILPTIELKKAALIHNVCNIYLEKSNIFQEINRKEKKLEEQITKEVFKKFEVNYDLLDRINCFDRRITIDELNTFNIKIPNELINLKPLGINIISLSAKQSREIYRSYLERYFKIYF